MAKRKTKKERELEKKRTNIRETLILHLGAKGGIVDHYEDLIDDYMNFWDTKNALNFDVKSRGVMFVDMSSVGVQMQKNNPSVKEMVMVNRQMLSILKEMGLTTDNVGLINNDEM